MPPSLVPSQFAILEPLAPDEPGRLVPAAAAPSRSSTSCSPTSPATAGSAAQLPVIIERRARHAGHATQASTPGVRGPSALVRVAVVGRRARTSP